MYSKCGLVDVARKVFDENPKSRELTVCYNALIAGYSLNMRVKDTVLLLCEMRELEVPINGVTMLGVVPVCGVPGNLGLGVCVHCFCMKLGLNLDLSVGNGLLSMYLRCACAHLGAQGIGMEVERHMHACGFVSNPFLNNALINMYARCGNLVKARQIFDSLPVKSLISWTAIIGGYGIHGHGEIAVELFDDMIRMGTRPDGAAFVNVLSACSHAGLTDKGKQLHCQIIRTGCLSESFVRTSLLSMYSKCGFVDVARQVFDENPQSKELTSCYNALISGYLRCGEIISGRKLFDEMPRKRLVTWNAIINGYAQNGLANDVLELYREMGSSGIHPNPLTLVGVLSSCANLGAHEVGMEVEMQTHARGFMLDPFLNSGLINMYARCGNLVKAREIFDGLSANNLVSWTAIIGSYGMHGEGEIAVELFDDMIKSGTRPDGRVFVNVLSACSHAGLTDKGLHYFDAMEHKYKLHPGPEHYSCMVDLLGRAGRLEEAHRLIKSMKAEPDDAVWGALLGACKIHRNVELAELAFERVIELEPTNIGYYVLLSNIYKDAGNSEGILRIRRMMRERKLKKDPGCSYVEFMGKVHIFLSGDKSHPQSKQIYKFLDELESEMKELDSLTTEGEKNIISDEEPKNIWRLSLVHEDS
ncbi:Putative pentatricopeptide repeat-containing protein At3g11460, mitochondrial [Linum perenne]